MDWDPFNFKRFDSKNHKILMTLFLTCITCTGVSLICFILSLTSSGGLNNSMGAQVSVTET